MRASLFHPSEKEITLDRVLTALADPIRRDIAARMYREGALWCSQLAYPIAKSTLSHHLKVLRESGIMRTEVHGTQRRITLREDELERRFPHLLGAVGVTSGAGESASTPAPAGS